MQLKKIVSILNFNLLPKQFEINKNNYASVGILIVNSSEILFIKRSEEMPTHKGHIAFPGGRCEENDLSIVDTAAREVSEELLIPKNSFKPLGYMEPINTIEYQYKVHPIIFSIDFKPTNFDKKEVQAIHYASILKLSSPQLWEFRGRYADDWVFKIEKEELWGASAKIIRILLNIQFAI